jgi:hypothetical protein
LRTGSAAPRKPGSTTRREFAINQSWLELTLIACDLIA